jgi:hypothetical protein
LFDPKSMRRPRIAGGGAFDVRTINTVNLDARQRNFGYAREIYRQALSHATVRRRLAKALFPELMVLHTEAFRRPVPPGTNIRPPSTDSATSPRSLIR